MRSTDTLLARYVQEMEERQQFIDGLVSAAAETGGDLSDEQMELVTRARDRIEFINRQMGPLEEARRIGADSADRVAQLARFIHGDDNRPTEVNYRSAGEWIIDYWRSGLGQQDAQQRMDLFMRAAAHQTTADNPGLLPEQIMGPVINFVDAARPLVNALGPRQLPSGSWSRPQITQHTSVAEQTAEKTELASQKLVIGKIPVNAKTFGTYLNVSRQNVDWSQPAVMDIIVQDMALQYALVTENEAADTFTAAATAGPTIPTGPATGDAVAAAIWAAVGQVYAGMHGVGTVLIAAAPDMLGMLGPIFAPINPTNAFSAGFNASAFGQGGQGSVAGLQVVVSAGLNAGTLLVMSTAAAEVYEDRIGQLTVVEPSVLGIQVAYGGYFSDLVIEPAGIVKVTKTP